MTIDHRSRRRRRFTRPSALAGLCATRYTAGSRAPLEVGDGSGTRLRSPGAAHARTSHDPQAAYFSTAVAPLARVSDLPPRRGVSAAVVASVDHGACSATINDRRLAEE